MFGGVGLYSGEVFFGILAGDTLYLKTNDKTRPRFEDAGCQPFEPYPGRVGSIKYFSVPLAVLEHADDLAIWVEESIHAAALGRPRGRPLRSAKRLKSTHERLRRRR